MKLLVGVLLLCSQLVQADDTITNQIITEANAQGLEPQIALAVATVESGLNPKAVGLKGEVGVFQLYPKFIHAKLDTQSNIKAGVQHLLYWKKYCPVKEKFTWVTCYNQGFRAPKYPELLPYYKKISVVMKQMEGAQ